MKDDLRCAVMTRSLGEDPGGSASEWHRIALPELPHPWPDKIERHPLLADRPKAKTKGVGTRVLALGGSTHPEERGPFDGLRLVGYHRVVDQPFGGFDRTEVLVAPDRLGEMVSTFLETPTQVPIESDRTVRDLLICTHGTRDRCCGKFGMDLFTDIADRLPPDVAHWRTSHTGGHRFAPTALTLPDGCLWAHLDVDLMAGIVDRTADPERAARHLRGCVGLGGPASQLVDRAGLVAHGWDWLDATRSVTVGDGDDGQAVRIDYDSATLGSGSVEAEVVPGESVPVPDCGNPLELAKKSAKAWSVGPVTLGS